ncbi:MAG TPA: hypothetical protein VMW48_20755 [Vicinamibacterales bacterium]|nr:hypothetical protein [Vicinamibacterales bacterium]
MKRLCLLLIGAFAPCAIAHAAVAPVAVSAPETQAWIGQRVPFFVELRAPGSFAGTASFDLPQLPGTTLMKIGSPVVSSQLFDGESWFVQTQEFALFSQRPGRLDVPSFAVHFARRDGFTGPATDVEAQAPGWTVEIRRPPGSDAIGFLITTESLDVDQTWDPQPGPAQVGEVFERNIVQRALQVSGMALAPVPTAAPDGVRIYPGVAATSDQLQRGDFVGERRDTVTYLLTKPGTITLPALAYVSWNPKTEQLQSRTLASVTFDVAPAAALRTPAGSASASAAWRWLIVFVSFVGLAAWQGRRVVARARRFWKTVHPPARVAARKLLRACRANDHAAAGSAWLAWRSARCGDASEPGPALRSAVIEMQRHRFGRSPAGAWRGDALARAFRDHRSAVSADPSGKRSSALPALNP